MAANQNVTQLTQQTGSAALTSLFYAVTGGNTDTGLPLSVFVNSLGLTGTPTTPTAAVNTNTTQIASCAFVIGQAYAPLASPALTGVPTTPTAAAGTNTTQIASTAYVLTSYAAPPAIGNTTPNSGSFTTLGTSGLATLSSLTTSSATISGGTINSTSVGATTPSTGKFTSLQATSTITPATTSGIVGTTLADNANAGSVGEYQNTSTTGTSLTTATAANATSISLTAGDWDVWGTVYFNPAGTTTISGINAGINTTSATLPAIGSYFSLNATLQTGGAQVVTAPMTRINISTTTTVYMVALAGFGTSTMTCNGYISARRRR